MENIIQELLEKDRYTVYDLVDVVKVLRSENGCPWDKVQTHESIKCDFLEEVYEVIEAIEFDNREMLLEELGDVLLQVVFHTQIEVEKCSFNLDDVATDICQKLIIRHPHVFGEINVNGVDDVLKNWDSIKKDTKGQETYTDTLKSVPKVFPALMRAQKLGKRSSRARADYTTDLNGQLNCFDNINDECCNLHKTVNSGDIDKQKEALGDLLFTCCNMARELGFDAEEVLSESSERFINRFESAEKSSLVDGKKMSDISINELDNLWRNVTVIMGE